jgi:hypothetical protein
LGRQRTNCCWVLRVASRPHDRMRTGLTTNIRGRRRRRRSMKQQSSPIGGVEAPGTFKHGEDTTEATMDDCYSELSDSYSLSSSSHASLSPRRSLRHDLGSSYAALLASIPFERKGDDDEEDDDSDASFHNSTGLDRSITLSTASRHHKFSTDLDDWEIIKILGEGAFGQVAQVRRKKNLLSLHDTFSASEESYALKMLSKYQIICDHQVDVVVN